MPNKTSKAASASIQLKRVYESPETRDGVRVLVDRLWARGVSKEAAHLAAWMKELGPTTELRKWFGHRPDRWDGFVEKYRRELETPVRQLLLAQLKGLARGSTVTLVYGAHDAKENEAVVLHHYLLHDSVSSDDKWEAADKLLVTAAAVAAAHHDGFAPDRTLKLFASQILTEQEIGSALKNMLTSGTLRQSSGGWRVTARGLKQIQESSRAGSTADAV